MNFCGTHFGDLCTMLKRKELWGRVSNDKAETVRRAKLWLAGRASLEDLDPLVISALEIQKKALELLGYEGEKCPLCAVAHSLGEKVSAQWVDNCTDAVRAVVLANQHVLH